MSFSASMLDRLLDPLAESLTHEAARRIVDLQLDPSVQERVEELRAKSNEGLLTDAERAEYKEFIEGMDLMGILKSKARVPWRRLRLDGCCGVAD